MYLSISDFYKREEIKEIKDALNELRKVVDDRGISILEKIEEDFKIFFESVEQHRAILEASHDAVIIHDEREILYANKQALILYGAKNREDLTGKDLLKYIHEEDREAFLKGIKEVIERGLSPYSIEFRIITDNGEVKHINSKVTPLTLKNKRMVLASLRDVSEYKRIIANISEREKQYRDMFEKAVEGFFQTTPDGRFLMANPALARMFGYYSPAEMIEDIKNLEDHYVNPEDRIRMKELYEKYGYISGFETQFYRKDNKKIWIRMNGRAVKDEKGNILYYEGTTEDITERVEAENILKESEARFRTLIENSNDGIAIIKGSIFLFVNRRFAEIFGFKAPDEVIGRDIFYVVHNEDREKVGLLIKKKEEGINSGNQFEFKGVKRNGETLYIEVSLAETFFYNEKLYVGFFRDETERKRLEAQLFQSQKMEAIGQLAGGIAHDFNNILTAIIGYAGLLDLKMDKTDHLRQYVKQILSAAERAANLTKGLLAFSRKQIINLKPIDLNQVVRDFKGILSRIIGEDIELELKLSEKELFISADPHQIEQVILNLATNARDAMPHGGRLIIETGSIHIDHEFIKRHHFGKLGKYAYVSVTDTGIGMDDETKKKIFDPFFTTKEVGRGTGLGLSIVYGIVKQHNGFIIVDSNPGAGSTFKVLIPLSTLGDTHEEKEDMDRIEKGTETVLICEDDDAVRSFMEEIIASAGYHVLSSKDGDESIEIFKRFSHTIDVVILDIIMPKKTGVEVYEVLRQERPDIKVLFISGYPKDILEKRSNIYKELQILTKPITPQKLLNTIRALINNRNI